MVIDPAEPLTHGLIMAFILAWVTGFILRIINERSFANSTVSPSFRQIKVIGLLRWLFGYPPVTGPVSMIGAIFQIAAYLTIGATIVLAWLWPNVFHTLYWLLIVVFALALLFALRFVPWLRNKQQSKK